MMPPTDDLDVLFKRLHLANARRVWRDLVQRAERESWPYLDFLTLLAAEEIAHRQQTRLARLSHRGAVDADGRTGDGAGVGTQIPHALLAVEFASTSTTPPARSCGPNRTSTT